MKKSALIFSVFLAGCVLFSSCLKDEIAPKIQLLGFGGIPIQPKTQYGAILQVDTTILLYTKYVDPGVRAEDNATQTENLKITSDIDNVILNFNKNNGYVKRTGVFTITYTVMDDNNNQNHISRIIRVANPAEIVAPFNENTQTTATNFQLKERTTSDGTYIVNNGTTNITFSADPAIPGAIRINKAFYHIDPFTNSIVYFPITFHLYNSTLSQTYSATIGYMGKPDSKDVAFYDGLTPLQFTRNVTTKEVFDMLTLPNSTKRIQRAKIEYQQPKENGSGDLATITQDGDCSISYIGDQQSGTEVEEITLKYRIIYKRNGVSISNNIVETYKKRYLLPGEVVE
ncbi:MAG: DUF5011 domain-containing protein [Bacteroidales bacterium]|nr:DUF5011 domain-containing protein [Bacteroidales bacterium]